MFRKNKKREEAVPQPLFVAEGKARDLEVWPNRIVIRSWKNKKKKRLRWEKTLRPDLVSGVQLSAPGMFGLGYLQIAVSGDVEHRDQGTILTRDTLLDENTVHFEKKQLPAFQEAKNHIEGMILAP